MRVISLFLAVAMGGTAYSAPQAPTAEASPAPTPQPLHHFDKAIFEAAKQIVPILSKGGYKSVGVLKFGLTKSSNPNADLGTLGTLNTILASKTEAALFCSNGLAMTPLDITGDASEVAAAIPGADHSTKKGRAAILGGKYRKIWGQNTTTPDIFIVGAGVISADLTKMKVILFSFDKDTDTLLPLIPPFDVAMEASMLPQIGENSRPIAPSIQKQKDDVTRAAGMMPSPKTIEKLEAADRAANQAAVEDALKIKQGNVHPLADPNAPVTLVIKYDGVEQRIDYVRGEARIAEPAASVKDVTIDLVRRGDAVYRAVLKVNGENTICRQTAPDPKCFGWILDQDSSPLTVTGYQLNDNEAEKFRIMSDDESKMAVEKKLYGNYVGMITLSVFRKAVAKVAQAEDDEFKSLMMIGRAKRVAQNSQSENYFESVSRYMNNPTRGLIAPGEKVPSRTFHIEATWDPIPVMTATVVYYKK